MTGDESPLHRATRPLMGTFVTVTLQDDDTGRATEQIDLAFDAMTAWCDEASEWEPGSALSRFAAAPVNHAVPISEKLFQLLTLAEQIWRDSSGAFDPSWLPLKALWPIRGQSEPPAADAVASALAEVGLHGLQLGDGPHPRAVKSRAGLQIGLGAIAKGAAVDLACEALAKAAATRFLVDAGGDVRGATDGAGWLVGIRDGRGANLHSALHLRRGAVATSGSYEAGFEHEGQRYHHLLDPRTGYPVPRLGGVTVVASACALADALATACFVLGPSAGRALLRHHPGSAALWLAADGTETASDGWPNSSDAVELPPATGFC